MTSERGANPSSTTGGQDLATFTFRVDENLKSQFTSAAKAKDRSGAQLLRDFMRDPIGGCRTLGLYAGPLGWAVNEELLKKQGKPLPRTWEDLARPEYKGLVAVANPNTSGTAYTMLVTILQVFGEQKGWDYLARLHKYVAQYTKSGSAPGQLAGRGDATGQVLLVDAELGGLARHRQRRRRERSRQVDPQQHLRSHAQPGRRGRNPVQFQQALHVQPLHALLDGLLDLGRRLGRAAEDDRHVGADGACLVQLAARGHLETGDQRRERAQQRGVVARGAGHAVTAGVGKLRPPGCIDQRSFPADRIETGIL